MTATVRRWVQAHRYQETIHQLRALSSDELRALGIAPSQIEHLAVAVSQASSRP